MVSEPDRNDLDEADSSNVKKVNLMNLDDSPGVKTRTRLKQDSEKNSELKKNEQNSQNVM